MKIRRDKLGRFASARKVPLKKVPPKKVPPKKAPPKKAPPKKKRKKKEEVPLLPARSLAAETEIQSHLVTLQSSISLLEPGLDLGIQTFINKDGTVDGELRISNLPEDWRTVAGIQEMLFTLSNAFTTFPAFDARPSMGGAYWASFGIRFGPQNEAEIGELAALYKRHRGLFQIGTYPTPAWNTGPLQIALVSDTVGLRAMATSLLSKRGLPPTVVLIRFIWTPDGLRPSHYSGEKGEE